MAKIYIVMCSRQYEDSYSIKAFKDKQKAHKYVTQCEQEQDKEDEEEGIDSGYYFFIKDLEYEE